ncbi:MAG: ABC transporter permease [Candidatus Acidiferrales bacterium]
MVGKRGKSGGTAVALGETLLQALDTLRAHKLRSFLTLLGIILAVTTLVAVMSVVNGLNLYVATKIANLGANSFVVTRTGIITNAQQWYKAQRWPRLTASDYDLLRTRMQLAKNVAAEEDSTHDARFGNQLYENADLMGVSANYADIRNLEVALGRGITPSDDEHRAPVCLLGADVATKLFPNEDPLGKTIRVESASYQVVGVAAAIGSVFGISQDNFVIVPFRTYQQEWNTPTNSIAIFVEAYTADQMDAAADEVRIILRSARHVPYDAEDNFGIIMPSSIMNLWQEITGNIFAIAVWLTSVFLVIGGIVIMNIMLASVTERTREIGIRKALGARRRHIVLQFLLESAVLSAAGGVMGLVLALGLAALVRATTPMPISTPWSVIITALAMSTTVGLFFGIYPAVRASRLDPIVALRAE